MKRRKTAYAVSRKNPLTWIAALLSVCAGIGYVAYVTCGKGAGVSGWDVCFRVILPVLAALLFAQTVLVHPEERTYRIAVSYWMLAISFVYALANTGLAWYLIVGLALLAVAAAVLVHRSASGLLKGDWLIVLVAGIGLAGLVYYNNAALHAGFSWESWLAFLPDACFLAAFMLIALALYELPEGEYHLYWGDRYDGRLVRSLDPITNVGVYIMPDRNGASNLFRSSVEISRMEKFMRKKKLDDMPGLGVTELLLAAMVRTFAEYPALNRFISGQKIYSHGDDIQYCMTIKKEMSVEGSETIIKLHLKPTDTLKDVYEKFRAAVDEAKGSEELDSDFDGLAALIGAIPGVLLKFTVWLLKTLDYFGLLPKVLLELSPFHGSLFFTSMGSLGIPPIFHHLYDFGNLPVFCSFGCKRRARELGDEGQVLYKKYIDFTINCDERIADGFYYASAFKYFQRLLQKPEQLELPPEEVKHDVP